MTTDITELAQREKFEAWAEEAARCRGNTEKHRNQDGNYPPSLHLHVESMAGRKC